MHFAAQQQVCFNWLCVDFALGLSGLVSQTYSLYPISYSTATLLQTPVLERTLSGADASEVLLQKKIIKSLYRESQRQAIPCLA